MKLLALFLILLANGSALKRLNTLYEWDFISFAWPNETAKQDAIEDGLYIPEDNLPLGTSVWRNKLFFTIPRFRKGVAASLAYVDLNDKNKSPDLIPYPSWAHHDFKHNSAEAIISSYRSFVDVCDRLWLVDLGLSGLLLDADQQVRHQPAAVKIIDLQTDRIIHTHNLRAADQVPLSFLSAIIVDIEGNDCNKAYAYIADPNGYGLVVYSLEQDDTWRFTHNFFYFEPLVGNFWLNGLNYQYNDGIFGIALGPKHLDGERTLYFHAYISYCEFSVNTATLKNKSQATNTDHYAFKLEGFKGENTTSLISQFDETTNTIFMAQPGTYGIACWNINKTLNPHNFHLVAQDYETINFPCDIQIDRKRDLYVLTQKFPIFQFSKLPKNKVNVRVFKQAVDEFVEGTGCGNEI